MDLLDMGNAKVLLVNDRDLDWRNLRKELREEVSLV